MTVHGKISFNLEMFAQRFDAEYSYLYKHNDNIPGFIELATDFDAFVRIHPEFVARFVRFRGDAITSDREAAAFMVTLRGMATFNVQYSFY